MTFVGAGTPFFTSLLEDLPPAAGSQAGAAPGNIPSDPEFKVAFIGDTGNGEAFAQVLHLIRNENADLVLHQGDFDYGLNAAGFFHTIDTILGPDFPFLAAVGNHDIDSWRSDCGDPDGCYAQFLKDRMARLGMPPDDPNLDDQMYSVTYRGLKIVFVGQDGIQAGDTTYAPYIRRQLINDEHIWKICSWHKNQNTLQVGGKRDEMGWNVYETCRQMGAIIATAHEHSYERTKTLTNMQFRVIDPAAPAPDYLRIAPGKTFVFVSGLGGRSIRAQIRCHPTTYPYGCHGEWASIYTSNQNATYGVLFITFHVDGDPRRARGYFKNIAGEIIDEFEITVAGGTPPTATPSPTASSTPVSPSPTPTPSPPPPTELVWLPLIGR